jgi:hypothetical protein
MEGVSRTNGVPDMEYALYFLKNDKVQQPVIFPNINENQNPWHIHIFSIHTNIQQNKRLLPEKTVVGVSRTNDTPYM